MRTGAHGPFNWNLRYFVGTYQILARWVHKSRAETCGERKREAVEKGGQWRTRGGQTERDNPERWEGGRGKRGEGRVRTFEEREAGCYEATDLRSSWSGMYCE